MTPEELEQQVQREKRQRQRVAFKSSLLKTVAQTGNVVQVAQLTGLDRINQTLNNKLQSVKSKSVTQFTTLAEDLNITGVDTDNPTLPAACPSESTLDKALQIRDNLVEEIENTVEFINIVNKSLTIVNDVVNGTITTLTALNSLKLVTSLSTKALPVVPGAVSSLLADLDDVRTIITFKNDGNPRLPQLKRAVALGVTYTAQASIVLTRILDILKVIDTVLSSCGKSPRAINVEVVQAIQQPTTNLTYKGFIFDIIEKPFSPTVNQKIGQARNKQGIVLLQTEPSFASDPQVLIEELKLIIDRDNLKPD